MKEPFRLTKSLQAIDFIKYNFLIFLAGFFQKPSESIKQVGLLYTTFKVLSSTFYKIFHKKRAGTKTDP